MFEHEDYSDIFNDAAQDAWIAEVIEWARKQGIDADEYDEEQIDQLSKEYREELELAMGWKQEVYLSYKERN